MSNYNDMSDADFLVFYNNLTTVAAANVTPLGLSPADVTTLNTAKTNYTNGLNGRVAAADAAKAATITKNSTKVAALNLVRLWANQWQNDPAVSDELKSQLGLPIHDETPSPRPIFTCTQLSATGYSNGVNKMRWFRNGNLYGASFVVEFSRDNGTTWSIAGVSTKASFDHLNQPPVATLYRVRTERRGLSSPPTDPVALFFEGGETIQLQQAA